VRQFSLPTILVVLLTACVLANAQTPADKAPQATPATDTEVPALVMHLPNWETVKKYSYVVTLNGLKEAVPSQPILDSIDFEGGTEAVAAHYGQSQLVIVEFANPHFASDNDRLLVTRIQELKGQGQPSPSSYRRVGNYSVFVFNATDEAAANQLIDQVRYQKVVQWLGDDPLLYDRLQRYFAETSAGVLVAVLKSSGLSLIACLAIGGLAGFLMFRHRRAQRAAVFSDAGGSVRLNLDDLTGIRDSSRLLEPPKQTSDTSKA
jgi:hypothetical protein